MKHHDKDLKMYAGAGLRTVEDWVSHGRAVQQGSAPMAEGTLRGKAVMLFSRAQTEPKVSTRLHVPRQA
jgi:hypothetical protein